MHKGKYGTIVVAVVVASLAFAPVDGPPSASLLFRHNAITV